MCRQVSTAITINDADCGRGNRDVLEKVSCLRFTCLHDLGKRIVSDTEELAPDFV